MVQAVLSTKYQLVIPLEVRKKLHLRSGQKMVFLLKGDVITVVPERSLSELKGIAQGIRPGPLREKKERLA